MSPEAPSSPTPSSPRPSSASASASAATSPAAEAASEAGAEASAESAEGSSLPVPIPEKPQSLWRRLSMRGGRRPILGPIDEQLELIRTRLEVVEEQLRSLGGALGRTVDRVGDRIDEASEGTARAIGSKFEHLGRLENLEAKIGERVEEKLGLVDQQLAGPLARLDEQLDAIGAAVRSDLGRINTQFATRVDALGETVARTQREASESAREDRDRLEGRLTELWEVGDQLNQIEELVERATEARDESALLAGRVQVLTWCVAGLTVLLVAGALTAAALRFGWISL